MSDPGDLIGLLHKNPESGRSEFLPPYWWPTDETPVVLFLDELNRARPEILQAVMDLTLNRSLAGRTLPPGSRVLAAVNEGERYQLTELDPALVSRFNVYHFHPTVDEWLDWAQGSGLDARVISFIHSHPEYLDEDPKSPNTDLLELDISPSPDRRAWERVSGLVSGTGALSQTDIKMIAGVVGISAALAFSKSVQDENLLSAEDILYRFGKNQSKISNAKLHELTALNERIMTRIEKSDFTTSEKKKALKGLQNYIQFLTDESKNEICSHFASLLERPVYAQAAEWVLADSKLLMRLVDFISGIEVE